MAGRVCGFAIADLAIDATRLNDALALDRMRTTTFFHVI